MSTMIYQCPCCGAPLAYGAKSGKLECAACGNEYELDALEAMNEQQTEEGIAFELPKETFDAQEAQQMRSYVCEACGAELMTEETTTATECPYCGSPTVLPERIEGGVKPELVVPFTITREEAQQEFEDYFKGKKLLPNVFLNTRNRIAEMRKLYVPYWLFDCEASGSVVYDAEEERTYRQGDWEITETDHYVVRRAGGMAFEGIPVDGSEKLDNKITESLEPYDMSAAVPFAPAVLAGALADHADVDAQSCESRAIERVETSMEEALRATVKGYTRVDAKTKHFAAEGGKVTPVLMPVWLITTEKEGKTYTFAINGQTGQLTCDVPADTKKSLLWGGGVFACVMAVVCAVMAVAGLLDGFMVFMAAITALVAAGIVVAVLIGQLKQAVSVSGASNYARRDTFELTVSQDHFLYRSTSRRKIEQPQEKKG